MPTFLTASASFRIALTLLLFLVFATPGLAQILPLTVLEQQAVMEQQARQRTMDQLRSGQRIVAEGAVDENEYIVGPGDYFMVGIGGARPEEKRAVVGVDGILMVSQVGAFNVAGLTLAEARETILAGLRPIYSNVSLTVSLTETRQFYVHVAGEVQVPGRHVMVPIARIEDAVAAAMGDRGPLMALRELREKIWESPRLPGLRNVEVRRSDGSVLYIDLLYYYSTGDISQNPFLQDGDQVFVPGIERGGPLLVHVEREGETTGEPHERYTRGYDYRPDDTLTRLLEVRGGYPLVREVDTVQLLRADDTGRLQSQTINVAAIRNDLAEDVPILPLDRILIPRPVVEYGTAAAMGFVQYPGSYPIVEFETTLRELIEAAGGLRPDALLRGAYLERAGVGVDLVDLEQQRMAEATASAQDLLRREAVREEQETYENARLSNLSFSSRYYLTREINYLQRVSINFTDNLDDIPDIRLQDGDRLIVPRDPNAVHVIGQVRYPGYVTYVEGAGIDYYIQQAGGLGPAATDIFLQDVGSGFIGEVGRRPIRSGDVIFVDRTLIADTAPLQSLALQEQQIALQQAQERRMARVQLVQTTLSVVSTALAVITTYLLIADRN